MNRIYRNCFEMLRQERLTSREVSQGENTLETAERRKQKPILPCIVNPEKSCNPVNFFWIDIVRRQQKRTPQPSLSFQPQQQPPHRSRSSQRSHARPA